MKTSERHHLKENELAQALAIGREWFDARRGLVLSIVGAVVLVGGGAGGYVLWQGSVDTSAAAMLAEAMVVEESRVQPPGPPAGTTNDPTLVPGQAPGTYPTVQARLEAALPKFLAAADAYPSHVAGLTARYHAAATLVELGRFDEAVQQYDRVAATGTSVVARMAALGKAEAQVRARQFEPAIATLKDLAARTDSGLPADGVLMELARAYRLAGKPAEAARTLSEIVEKHSESPFAAEARAELGKTKS